VPSPGPTHAPLVWSAITGGKNVYTEWPLTFSTPESEQLLALAEEKGVRHVIGLQRRFAPSARYVRDLLVDGYVGRVRGVRMSVGVDAFAPRMPQRYIGSLADDALFSIHIEGAQRLRPGLQIDITGTEGVLRVTNARAYENVQDNTVWGMNGTSEVLEELPVPVQYRFLADAELDASTSGTAYLYAALAEDLRTGTHVVPDGPPTHRRMAGYRARSGVSPAGALARREIMAA